MKTTARTGTAASEETWTLAVGKLALDRVAVDFEDRGTQPAVRIALRELAVTAANYTNARGGEVDVTARTRVGERGRIAFTGPVVTNPFALAGNIDASGLALVAVKPYLEPRVNVVLTNGTLAAKGRVALDTSDAGPMHASWSGNVTIANFAALDAPTASDLVRWKTLALDGLDVGTAPARFKVDRIDLEDYFARVIVYADGGLNLVRLLKEGPPAETGPVAGAAPAAGNPPVTAAAPAPAAMSIGRIEFLRGNVNFSDFFVKPNYSVNLTEVTGSVTSMSAEQAGDVAIAANIDRTAPVEVTGRIHPFAQELSLDVTAKARDIDLPPLTTYAVKFAGYGIEKGKLTFDVHYRVDNRKLSAENQLVLDQLTFGDHVDSPTATKLPVKLAVALLRDSRGVINIHLPIAGSLDDPEFSVGGLIIQVIINLIGKAATAPFALLAAAFGGGQELSTLTFAAGSAAIGADAQRSVDTLAKALSDRPAIKLDVGGHADPDADREALRRAAVDNAMRREKMKWLAAAGNAPASVADVSIDAAERERWLTAAYREAPLPERPRNVIGMLKDVPPAEMEAMLYANAKVDDEALKLLANARAEAVKEALAAKGVAGDRMFLLAPRLGSGASTASASGAPAPKTAARVDFVLR
jgi:hypothetical protein